jgi:hypothetical protein
MHTSLFKKNIFKRHKKNILFSVSQKTLTLYRQAIVVVCLNLCLVYLVYFRSEADTPLHPAWRHVVID